MSTIYDFSVQTANGETKSLADFRGQVLLIVNTASRCGFTPQYVGLEALYKKYAAQGFVVLGFPCNQFGGQEPEDIATIQQFCQLSYGVSFPLFAKIKVNGEDAAPLFQYLKSAARGVLGTEAIKWNFTKFLLNRDGTVLERYGSAISPKSLEAVIETALQQG